MGKTIFYILRPPAPPGYSWVQGLSTKIQTTSHPDNILPEVLEYLRQGIDEKDL